ncbi:M24 family metallopeptidase [Paenarthrobacter sp. DKR-5]|uniref:M24 family metallopeptidase n=1 Tax=Paenarthrobacter sp. DKR-5 TaxID=2835535 RepID=UPI001BDC5724|nr:aminopeptidase P family protein [Paenarthrobacter sp. DKR-5]MBT1001305.1 M24 family metallopeptidase [Paenarthrobacter sp. DKR-5]
MSELSTATRSPGPGQDGRTADRIAKRQRVLRVMDDAGADSLLLTSVTALSWYLDGGRVQVSLAGDPVAALLVTRETDHLVTFSNEAARLRDEELPAGLEIHEIPWFGSLTDVGNWYGPASPVPEAELARPLRDARRSLLPGERQRYAALCAETAALLTDVLTAARPDLTERELSSQLAERVAGIGADPLVVLANGPSRAGYRHPLPTDTPLGRRAMAVVCARRDGLISNVTRWVRFGNASGRELDAEARIREVEADAFAATVPGAELKGVLAGIARSYGRHGFGADQWLLHHQGGPAGYAGRDPRATPAADDTVVLGQAFAWNPSAPGVKVEDTVLLTGQGMQVLSSDPRWPAEAVHGVQRPLTLEL